MSRFHAPDSRKAGGQSPAGVARQASPFVGVGLLVVDDQWKTNSNPTAILRRANARPTTWLGKGLRGAGMARRSNPFGIGPLAGRAKARPAEPSRVDRNQYESEEITSPPLRVPSAHQVGRLTEFLTNRTEPSIMATLTPPGWLLLGLAPVSPSKQRSVLS